MVAFVAMMPIMTIQILGYVYRIKIKRMARKEGKRQISKNK
jgi:NADH:ubiquinone oxidoreductase subunit 3 (subunit A)